MFFFFFQAEDGIRDLVRSRGLGDVYKRQYQRRVRGQRGIGGDPVRKVVHIANVGVHLLKQALRFVPRGNQHRITRRRADLQAGANRRNRLMIGLRIADRPLPYVLQIAVMSPDGLLQATQIVSELDHLVADKGACSGSRSGWLHLEIRGIQTKRLLCAGTKRLTGGLASRRLDGHLTGRLPRCLSGTGRIFAGKTRPQSV
eukprot:TRINITY_DN2563_c0_g1_i13.p2 TRINITY_DN2563_c0_g1~~TRINITY_DN2563_c0_g1_i13.p2  ORF type:complete len:201 (+),score=31.30 TRINITY_DN2563_c0_g1_i13:82-684(+)